MKTKGYIALFLITALTGLQGISFAQEGGFIISDTEESNTVETTRGENSRSNFHIDPASKKSERTAIEEKREKRQLEKGTEEVSGDAKQVTPKKQPDPPSKSSPDNSPKKQEETEDSVLSFNILYYMIQKFKFSDVIDQ